MAVFEVYLGNTTQTSPLPAFDGSWSVAPVRRKQAPTSPDNSVQTGVAITLPNPTVIGADYGNTQFYSAAVGSALAAALVAGGVSVSGQLMMTASGGAVHLIPQLLLKVYDPVGAAFRGTALALQAPADPAATPPYLNAASTEVNRKLPSAANSLPLLTAAVAGVAATDVLVAEVGVHCYNAVAGAPQAFLFIGSQVANSDLPVDETTTTTTLNPWLKLTYGAAAAFVQKILGVHVK